ncbi:hypothetical protein FB451DRAFT_1186337 [Mycena latifolia]|nr:hypothetical protein FB451DRAFT_1186337 [Mycena latifolia]
MSDPRREPAAKTFVLCAKAEPAGNSNAVSPRPRPRPPVSARLRASAASASPVGIPRNRRVIPRNESHRGAALPVKSADNCVSQRLPGPCRRCRGRSICAAADAVGEARARAPAPAPARAAAGEARRRHRTHCAYTPPPTTGATTHTVSSAIASCPMPTLHSPCGLASLRVASTPSRTPRTPAIHTRARILHGLSIPPRAKPSPPPTLSSTSVVKPLEAPPPTYSPHASFHKPPTNRGSALPTPSTRFAPSFADDLDWVSFSFGDTAFKCRDSRNHLRRSLGAGSAEIPVLNLLYEAHSIRYIPPPPPRRPTANPNPTSEYPTHASTGASPICVPTLTSPAPRSTRRRIHAVRLGSVSIQRIRAVACPVVHPPRPADAGASLSEHPPAPTTRAEPPRVEEVHCFVGIIQELDDALFVRCAPHRAELAGAQRDLRCNGMSPAWSIAYVQCEAMRYARSRDVNRTRAVARKHPWTVPCTPGAFSTPSRTGSGGLYCSPIQQSDRKRQMINTMTEPRVKRAPCGGDITFVELIAVTVAAQEERGKLPRSCCGVNSLSSLIPNWGKGNSEGVGRDRSTERLNVLHIGREVLSVLSDLEEMWIE